MRTFLPVVLLCAVLNSGFAQTTSIQFSNPSFEDFPRASSPPIEWYNCGFQGESPPDVQPDPTFNVTKQAYDGATYLGMVVRDNDTQESVSQRLSQPFQKGACYQFEVYLARSLTYMSVSRISKNTANYATPVKLKVWAGYGHCDKQQLLGETKLVINTNWKPYSLLFETQEAYKYIIFEAYYDDSTLHPYNGNLLLDKLSEITQVTCTTEKAELPKETSPTKPVPSKEGNSPDVLMDATMPLIESTANETELAPQSTTTPISETELLQIVETSAPRIAFDASGLLETSLYNDLASGAEKQVNLPLQSIVDGLKQHSLATLIIVIVEKDAALAEKKRQGLRAALSQMGGRQDQIIIRNWLEKDAEKTWLGDPASGVLLRLIR